MRRPSSQLIGAAYYMAGHVVLAFHFGLVIKNIEVLENGDAGAELPAAEHLPQLDRVTVCLGGTAALTHFQAPATDDLMMADYAAILGFTPKMSNDEREAIIERGFARARSVVAKNAEEVARIAKVLMVWRSVDLSDVQPRVRATEIPISPRR